MPTVTIFGHPCRARPMLNAMGAQEAVECHFASKPLPMHGPTNFNAWSRALHPVASRRNAAERALRPAEHMAWDAWRKSPPATREAARAMLIDPPRSTP